MHVFLMPKKIIEGMNSVEHIDEFADTLDISHLFIVCSHRVLSKLRAITTGMKITFYTEVTGEPTTQGLAHLLLEFKESGADGFLAVGGGSILDLTKAAALMAKNQTVPMTKLDINKRYETYPLIAVPTTAGTGAEVTQFISMTDSINKIKYSSQHFNFIPDIVILDATFTQSLSSEMIALTGVNALAYAMEAFVSTKATKLTNHYALKAINLIGHNLPVVVKESNNDQAFSNMLFASNLTGLAFSNASINLGHATAHTMGSKLGLPHGLSVALTLIPTVEYGLDFTKSKYAQIAQTLGTTNLVNFLEYWLREFQIYELTLKKMPLSRLKEMIPELTQDTLAGQGIVTNQVIPYKADIFNVYEKIYKKLETYQHP